jgi:predicted SprT family Zn-dependent metalloprotease
MSEKEEWWKVGEDIPLVEFKMEKGTVEGKTRKLKTSWSLVYVETCSKCEEEFRVLRQHNDPQGPPYVCPACIKREHRQKQLEKINSK